MGIIINHTIISKMVAGMFSFMEHYLYICMVRKEYGKEKIVHVG
jgi:hypothetical protein